MKNKRSVKILSLVLVLIMAFSLVPVSASAETYRDGSAETNGMVNWWNWGWGGWWNPRPMPEPDPEPEPDPVEDPAPVEEVTYPATNLTATIDGLAVTVDAPEGALPEGTEMTVTPVSLDAVQSAVDSTDGVSGTVLAAADITFLLNGEEIQPNGEITVTMTSAQLADAENTSVVHLDTTAAELENADVEAEPVDSTAAGTESVTFDAEHFSVYAVIGEGQTGDEARATVNFYNGDTLISTVYVKNSDTLAELEDIVYDPGAGTIPAGQLFRGWSIDTADTEDEYVGNAYTVDTEPMTIEGVREYLEALSIKEGDVVNIYAMLFETFTVTYIGDDNISLGSHTVVKTVNDEYGEYTVNMIYTPGDNTHNFEGWNVSEGSSNIVSATQGETAVAAPYKNGTVLHITGNVKLSVYAPEGHWLVFDANGKGATYNAPIFIKSGETTYQPTNATEEKMHRSGYTFEGWYKDKECTQLFSFGGELDDYTIIYAKWEVVDTADYTVVVWKQKTTGGTGVNDYDFAESKTLSGTPNTVINTVTQDGASVTDADGTYKNVKVAGWKEIGGSDYLGFHADRFDTNVTINPNGSTVLNVYYNRNMVELRFNVFNSTGYERNYDSTPQTNVEYYGRTGTSYSGYTYFRIYYYEGDWIYERNGSYYYYTGNRYIRSGSWSEQTALRMRGLYGSTLAENNKTWPTTYDWYANGHRGGGVSGIRTTFLDAFIPASTSMIINYYGHATSGTHNIYFYQQNANGTGYTRTNTVAAGNANGINFNLSDKYTGFQCAQWSTDGTNWNDVGDLMNVDGDLYYDADPKTSGYQYIESQGDVYIRFNRLSYKIKYSDGTYFNGNNGVIDEDKENQGFGTSADITYGADISAYGNPSNTLYNKPTKAGYYFMGWYADSTCNVPYTFTTMPLGGVQVYAKWQQVQYRVFLHPNATLDDGSRDASLSWGDEQAETKQAMNFRVDDGATVSLPTGTRNDYEMVGWYLDPDFNTPFDADNYPMNSTNVTGAYNKATDFTDTMDKWGILTDSGSNADTSRPWINNKLDLYLKWKAVLTGAKGINVLYDAGQGGNPLTIPTDPTTYDESSKVVAQAACSPLDTDKYQFLYWVVQKWNGSDYEDTDVKVYPGDNFTVKKSDARQTANADNTPDNPSYTYTVRLIAKYGEKDAPTPTHITWYSNLWDVNGTAMKLESFTHTTTELSENGKGWYVTDPNLQINQAVNIEPADLYSHPGYTFLGWARLNSEDANAKPSDLKESDLFLKYVGGKFYAKASDDATDWTVEVSQVAADEKHPYHDLYALWEPVEFYVYHSNNQSVETVKFTDSRGFNVATGTFDITKLVADGYLYGGYYNKYNKAGTYTGGPVNDLTTNTTGKNYTGGLGFWSGKNAITDVKGTAMVPEAGKTYYLKEVSNSFLKPTLYVIYDHNNVELKDKIVDMYLITAVDDTNYKEIGLIATDITTGERIKLAGSFTITDTLNNRTDKITASVLGAPTGFVAVWQPGAPSKDFVYTPAFVTPDGVAVEGGTTREVTVGNGSYVDGFAGPGLTFIDSDNTNITKPGFLSTRKDGTLK